nr:hypothetical protein [Prevotella micans]
MKKKILAAITVMAFITPCHAQSDSTISAMKQQKKSSGTQHRTHKD